MKTKIITTDQIEKRKYWVNEISLLSGNFGIDAEKVANEIRTEIKEESIQTLLGHLRLCGAIPEKYTRDSSEEKLYSKYTDVIISEAFSFLGFNSIVLKERADAADVEAANNEYSFVADAKAFRLSRTAKNQKDFKIEALDKWKYGKPYAILVSPSYQYPSRKSQIYEQATISSVCISSYTHLSVLLRYAQAKSQREAQELFLEGFKTIDALNPSKNAVDYWQAYNKTLLGFDKKIRSLWIEEKKATQEAIDFAKNEALAFLASERERILRLSKEEAIREVLKASKIDKKIAKIKSVAANGVLESGVEQ